MLLRKLIWFRDQIKLNEDEMVDTTDTSEEDLKYNELKRKGVLDIEEIKLLIERYVAVLQIPKTLKIV